jgi:hypothetical protein
MVCESCGRGGRADGRGEAPDKDIAIRGVKTMDDLSQVHFGGGRGGGEQEVENSDLAVLLRVKIKHRPNGFTNARYYLRFAL